MKDYMEVRIKEISNYILQNKATVRTAAKKFGVSKSTVFNDMVIRLPYVDPLTARQVKIVLDFNKEQRHIRGGQATRFKYTHKEGIWT